MVVATTVRYYSDLCQGLLNGSSRSDSLHTFSLVCTLRIWGSPHYRAKAFSDDIRKNLSNVAVPGTGIPLSLFCAHRLLAVFFLLAVNPFTSFIAALYLRIATGSAVAPTYAMLLLAPSHWFAIWRLNCVVVAYHALLTSSPSYALEDKGSFLLAAPKLGIAVPPCLTTPTLVAKHKNVEGGMAIHIYRNFLSGGDWILEPALRNSAFLSTLLPSNAPLSTLRVITASWQGLQQLGGELTPQEAGGGIIVATVVFRAGLAGAATDHASICFDVCRTTGVIGQGVSNQHWYKLGLRGVLRVGASARMVHTHHPDSGVQVTGQQLPAFGAVTALVRRAHDAMVPDVPLVGWDVALTDEGPCLLEMNISCNFFNGSYDRDWYTDFVRRHLVAAHAQHTLLLRKGSKSS